jgi:hypothetical protein
LLWKARTGRIEYERDTGPIQVLGHHKGLLAEFWRMNGVSKVLYVRRHRLWS